MANGREEAKRRRREELLDAAATIMAERGFGSTRIEDVAKAVGLSGPAVYRHFKSKGDLLAQVLMDVSDRLLVGAREVLDRHEGKGEQDARATLRELIEFHVSFAVTEPNRIRVHISELGNLEEDVGKRVRAAQRAYLNLWTDVLLDCNTGLNRSEARLRAQLVAGLINSTRYVLHWADDEMVRRQAAEMAWGSLVGD